MWAPYFILRGRQPKARQLNAAAYARARAAPSLEALVTIILKDA